MSSLPRVPLLGAREVTLERNLAPLVCYYRIKLPFKVEPVLSGLHTIPEHRSFPTAPTHFLLLCSRGASPLPALGTARGTQMGGIRKGASRFFSHPGKVGSKGKRPLSGEGELFWLWDTWGRRSRKQGLGAMEGQGELEVAAVRWGCLLSPRRRARDAGLTAAQLGTLSRGQTAGSHWGHCCAWTGRWRAAGTHLATPRVQRQLGISGRCAARKRAGFSFELQPLSLVVPNPGDPPLL